jgi:hypothetical protein
MATQHSYEEIRAAVLDILSGRERNLGYDATQFTNLGMGVAEVFARRERDEHTHVGSRSARRLAAADAETFLEVFWDLFREGIITLGLNDMNAQFPFFRLSRFGKKLIQSQDTYFFHDVGTYTALLQAQIPRIDPVTLLYVKEALQAFRAGCLLSSTVMLGVATEHTFGLIVEAAAKSEDAQDFAPVERERSLLARLDKFRRVLDQKRKDLPLDIREDLDTNFSGIQSIVRNFRNQAGHPTGQLIDREQVYVLLNLFVPYGRKMYQLIDHFERR